MEKQGSISPAGQPVAGGPFSLSPDCSPKLLEEPAVYDRATDELFFLSSAALDFLIQCSEGACPPAETGGEFLRFCLDEGILISGEGPAARSFELNQSPVPSLRYLLLHITDRCNLKCRHCFVGEPGHNDLSLDDIVSVADQLEAMQGLRLMVSGGEPLLHREFREIDDYLAGKDLRVILLTNGTLLDERLADRLRVEEVQISLDGLRQSHDLLRGQGTFDRAVEAIGLLSGSGTDVSVATMIHSGNLNDLQKLGELVRELGVREWSIDLPTAAGRMEVNSELAVEPAEAGPLIDLSFGGAVHEPLPGFACGAHLMAVMADGSAARCGFYAGQPVGHIREGLAACWQRVPRVPLAELDCDCEFLADCRGGCRYRAQVANSATAADLCQCYRYGVK